MSDPVAPASGLLFATTARHTASSRGFLPIARSCRRLQCEGDARIVTFHDGRVARELLVACIQCPTEASNVCFIATTALSMFALINSAN